MSQNRQPRGATANGQSTGGQFATSRNPRPITPEERCATCREYASIPEEERHDPSFDGPTRWWHCEQCGAHMERWRGQGDQACDGCNALYNAGGQRLRDDAPMYGGSWNDFGADSYGDSEIGDLEQYELAALRRDAELGY